MHPKFVLVSLPSSPRTGIFVYGLVGQHKELIPGYGKVHGGGWYLLNEAARTITLYGASGDYGPANLAFLNRIPSSLRGYRFFYSPGWNLPANELPLDDVEWF